jgi:hypothetical protein
MPAIRRLAGMARSYIYMQALTTFCLYRLTLLAYTFCASMQ